MKADWLVRTMSDAIENKGRPKIIYSDQGSQFASKEYIGYSKKSQRSPDIHGQQRMSHRQRPHKAVLPNH